MKAFVNDRAIEVEEGATVRDAVTAFDPELAQELSRGLALATDGVGRPADLTAPLAPGAILRVRVSARRPGAAE